MIIGVSGTIAAGETTLCEMLKKKGFKLLSLSDILREKLREQGKEITRENLRALGEKLRTENGMDVLAKLAFEKINPQERWVIDSVFTKEGAEYIQSHGGVIVGVVAPLDVRYERAVKRDGPIDKEEFIKKDRWDSEGRTDAVLDLADYIIVNDGSLEEFEDAIDRVIEELS